MGYDAADANPSRGRHVPAVLYISIAVFVVGLVLAVVGFVAGGPDEEARADLRDEVTTLEVALTDAEGDLVAAESSLSTATEAVTALLTDAQAILVLTDETCACSANVVANTDAVLQAVQRFAAAPSQATLDELNAAIDALNAELERNRTLLGELRILMIDRESIPDGSS